MKVILEFNNTPDAKVAIQSDTMHGALVDIDTLCTQSLEGGAETDPIGLVERVRKIAQEALDKTT